MSVRSYCYKLKKYDDSQSHQHYFSFSLVYSANGVDETVSKSLKISSLLKHLAWLGDLSSELRNEKIAWKLSLTLVAVRVMLSSDLFSTILV